VTKQNDTPLTYTVPQAGRLAGLSRNGSYLAVERGEIPAMRFGRLLRVPAAAWDQILREGRRPAPIETKPRGRLRRP
jgi:excisionase family DNA binding protein